VHSSTNFENNVNKDVTEKGGKISGFLSQFFGISKTQKIAPDDV